MDCSSFNIATYCNSDATRSHVGNDVLPRGAACGTEPNAHEMYRLYLSQAQKAWGLVWKPSKKLRTGPFSKRSNWSTSAWIVLFEAVFNACKPSFISHLPAQSCRASIYLLYETLGNSSKAAETKHNQTRCMTQKSNCWICSRTMRFGKRTAILYVALNHYQPIVYCDIWLSEKESLPLSSNIPGFLAPQKWRLFGSSKGQVYSRC